MPEQKRIRYEEVSKAGGKIRSLVNDCQKYFRSDDSSADWKTYLAFVDEVIIDGLLKAAACSLGYLLDETDQTLTQGILFEVMINVSAP